MDWLTAEKNGGKHPLLLESIKLAFFGIAFGYIEGSVVHYLRLHFYPHGFSIFPVILDLNTLLVESGREMATLVVLLIVALLTKGPAFRRLANFVFIFAIWDISYYASLFIFEGWPKTLLDWDVLFLIPVPWYAPVIAPVTISFLGIIIAIAIRMLFKKQSKVICGGMTAVLFFCALISWFISFIINPVSGRFQEHYEWFLFCFGILFSLSGVIYLIYLNSKIAKSDR
jgi:hypothetical protein